MTLVAVDLVRQEVVLRHSLEGDVVSMVVPPGLGVVALADRRGRRVILIEPSSLTVVATFALRGEPLDMVLLAESRQLVILVARDDGSGEILRWRFKSGRKGLKLKEEDPIPLSATPVRLALSPTQEHVAVSLTSAAVEVVELKHGATVGRVELPGPARDLVWCDPNRPGPPLAEWSDEKPPGLDLGG